MFFLKAAESLDGKLAEKARRLDDLYTQGTEDAKSFEAMLLDYTRLFLSPGSPPAKNYLTCWKDKLGDKILDEYLSYLGSRGFEVERDIKEPPEHIVPVLEIYELLEPEEKAEFFERFLSKFVLEWSLLLETEAKHEFYKELGRFLLSGVSGSLKRMAEFPEVYEEQAKIFKALGHPARLMMVEAMLENPKTVTELTNMVQLEMPTVSRHLAVLKEAQVVKAQKKANSIIYSIEMTCLKGFLQCSRNTVTMKRIKRMI